jgi:hypothetical protein
MGESIRSWRKRGYRSCRLLGSTALRVRAEADRRRVHGAAGAHRPTRRHRLHAHPADPRAATGGSHWSDLARAWEPDRRHDTGSETSTARPTQGGRSAQAAAGERSAYRPVSGTSSSSPRTGCRRRHRLAHAQAAPRGETRKCRQPRYLSVHATGEQPLGHLRCP